MLSKLDRHTGAGAQAEQAAGLRIDQVVVGVNCGCPVSTIFDGQVEAPGGIVTDAEIARRRAAWQPPAPRYTRGVLAKFWKNASSASLGAVLDRIE